MPDEPLRENGSKTRNPKREPPLFPSRTCVRVVWTLPLEGAQLMRNHYSMTALDDEMEEVMDAVRSSLKERSLEREEQICDKQKDHQLRADIVS